MSKIAESLRAPSVLEEVSASIASGVERLTRTLEGLVAEISDKTTELETLNARPLTRSALESQVRTLVAQLAPIGKVDPTLLRFGWRDQVRSQLTALSGAELVALISPDLLIDSMMAHLDHLAAGEGGWPSEQQALADRERERDLQAEILELESALAAARRMSWRSGIVVKGHERPVRDRPPEPSISTSGPGAAL